MVQIYHFNNGAGGGVFSVISNLLQYCQNATIENHIIYTINTEQHPHFEKPKIVGATSEQVFHYSPKWNFYHTCKALAKLLPNEKAVIIAHDWLELGMVSNLGLLNPVVYVLHGDFPYYYSLALKHAQNINAFIGVSPVITRHLQNLIPHEAKQIHYLRFPTPSVACSKLADDVVIRAAYCVNDLTDERKQFHIIPQIAARLHQAGVYVEWYLAGKGMEESRLSELFGDRLNRSVFYLGYLNKQGLNELFNKVNVLVLPSLKEGFPVVVVEAMKYGIVPLVTKWGAATDELIVDGKSGFNFPINDVAGYVDALSKLANNPSLLPILGHNAQQLANQYFDPHTNTAAYEQVFTNLSPKIKQQFKAYGSRLDCTWLPNWIVSTIRKYA